MSNNSKFRLLFIVGFAVFGGVIGAICSATGYASYIANVRSFWSPTAMGVFGAIGGLACALRILLVRKWSMPVNVAICVVSAAVFSAGLYFFQANRLGVKMAALPTFEYAAIMAAIMGVTAGVAVVLQPLLRDK